MNSKLSIGSTENILKLKIDYSVNIKSDRIEIMKLTLNTRPIIFKGNLY